MRMLSDASADSSSKRRLRRRPSRRTPRSAFARSPPPSHMTSLVTARANCRVTTGNRSERTHARVERAMASAVSTSSRVFVAALASAAVSADTAFAKPVATAQTAQTLERSSTPSSTIFDGSYYDPNHPGCPRAIAPALKGGVTISGLDPIPFERGRGCRGVKKTSAVASTKFNAWSIPAEVNGDEIIIDFNAKDGSGEKVTGRKVPEGIALPDGTTWTLKSLDKADAWTPR